MKQVLKMFDAVMQIQYIYIFYTNKRFHYEIQISFFVFYLNLSNTI